MNDLAQTLLKKWNPASATARLVVAEITDVLLATGDLKTDIKTYKNVRIAPQHFNDVKHYFKHVREIFDDNNEYSLLGINGEFPDKDFLCAGLNKEEISSSGSDESYFRLFCTGNKAQVDDFMEFVKPFKHIKVPQIEWVTSVSNGVNSSHIAMKAAKPIDKSFYPCLNGESVEAFVKRFMDSDATILLLIGPPGMGKAQPLYSPVLTPNGWSKMGDLKVGDEVVTPRNTISTILNVFDFESKPVYKLTFKDGRTTEACSEHLWKVRHTQKSNSAKSKWATIPTTEIIKLLGAGENVSIPLTNAIGSEIDVDLPLDPYLMGIILAEGTLNNVVTITNAEEHVIHKFSQIVTRDFPGYSAKFSKPYSYLLTSDNRNRCIKNPITETIKDLGLTGHNSYTKFIPELYFDSSIDQRFNLLQGLMDGDGMAEKKGGCYYSTSSKQLADDVARLVYSLGGTARIKAKDTFYTYKGEKLQGQTNYIVFISLKEPKKMFSSPQKHERLTDVWQDGKFELCNQIKSIEYVSDMPVRCIYIDDNEHLYLTNDYLVTHNTELITQIIWAANAQCMLTFSDAVSSSDSLFTYFIESDANILLVEDADTMLSARKNGNDNMKRILNISDGLTARKDKKFIFTTNLPSLASVDPALLRPGRCFKTLEFKRFNHEQALDIAAFINVELPVQDDYSLAEIFAVRNNEYTEVDDQPTINNGIGF